MREMDLAEQLELPPSADAEAGCGPFTHAAHREDGGGLERAREEGASGVALMMFGEEELSVPFGIHRPEALQEHGSLKQLLLDPNRHRRLERGEAAGRKTQVGFNQPLKFG